MDTGKLAQLKRKYDRMKGGEISNPNFAKAAARAFSSADRRRSPFADVPTLLSAPYRSQDPSPRTLCDLDVALIGIPLDLGVTNRPGARFGPRGLRSIERIGLYDHVLNIAPMGVLRVADIGDVPIRSRYSLADCHADIEAFYRRVVDAGIIPLSVGGDHSVTYPILKAVGDRRPVGLVQIDAHCDTGGEFESTTFHHGSPFRYAVLDGLIDPDRAVQIGIRGASEYLWEFSYDSGMTVLHMEDIISLGIDRTIEKVRAVVGAGPVYVSFDIDSLDPAFAPGTGTPEIGGLEPREALAILRGLAGINIVGGDVVEVAPQYDCHTTTCQCAAQMLFTLLCLVARRSGGFSGPG